MTHRAWPLISRGPVLSVVALAVLAVSLPVVRPDPGMVSVLTLAIFYAYLASVWNLVGGYAGQLSLAHAGFFGIGAYTSTLLFLRLGLTPWAGMLVGGALAAALGVGVTALAFRFRVRGVYFTLVTLAFSEVAHSIALNWPLVNGSIGLQIPLRDAPSDFQFLDRLPYYYVALALLAVAVWLSARIRHVRLGYRLLAGRENPAAAEAAGVNTAGAMMQIVALSAFLTAIGGTFHAQFTLYVQPDIDFSVLLVVDMVLRTMVGGAGTVWGPAIGAFFFAGLAEAVRLIPVDSRQVASASKALYALLLMGVVLYAPGGLVGLWDRVRPRMHPPGSPASRTSDLLAPARRLSKIAGRLTERFTRFADAVSNARPIARIGKRWTP